MKRKTHSDDNEMEPKSFIVRLYGNVTNETNEWRGQVEHIKSGEKRLFKGVDELIKQLIHFSG